MVGKSFQCSRVTEVLKIGITGVGGGVGQSIQKALSLSELPLELHAIDIQPMSAGLFRSEHAHVLPPPDQPGALDVWRNMALEVGLAGIFPGSDHDIPALAIARECWEAEPFQVLISDKALVDICRDKSRTVDAMRCVGLPAPESAWDMTLEEAQDWVRKIGYPVVLKPRDGYASRSVNVIEDDESLVYFYPRTPNPMLQEYLGDRNDPQEFTCSVFVDSEGNPVGTFVARRELSGGATYRAEVSDWPEIDALLWQIGAHFRPRGPLNIQLRMTERGPVPFEFNIRCSGTTAIRAHFGFNEPDMMIRHFILGESLEPVAPRHGIALRYWNEVFIDHASADDLRADPTAWSGIVRSWP